MEKIKVEAYLHGMKAGKITEIEYEEKVFVLKEQSTTLERASAVALAIVEKSSSTKEPKVLDRGKKIADDIYENVLEVVKKAINNHRPREEIVKEIGKFHPQAKPESHSVYYCAYIKHLYPQDKPKYLTFRVQKVETKTKPFRTYKKRKPKNSFCFDETYKTWILKEEYEKVNKALHKWAFVATTKSVAKETGLSIRRVNATLHYMKKKNIVFVKKENKISIYKLAF